MKTKNEFYSRMQVVSAASITDAITIRKMMQALIEEFNPQVVRLTSYNTMEIGQRFQTLQTKITTCHMQLATFFVKHTERGQVYV